MPGPPRGVAAAGVDLVSDATILIVDDDAGAVEIFEQILSANGYGVCVARDAASALREVQRAAPSAVLLDLHLPIADGVEFLRQVRASTSHGAMPIVVVTGDYFVDENVAREIQTLGARVHFKPLWEEDLLSLVNELLHR